MSMVDVVSVAVVTLTVGPRPGTLVGTTLPIKVSVPVLLAIRLTQTTSQVGRVLNLVWTALPPTNR